LKAVQEKHKAEQDRLKSAQERFVEADPMERQKALAALEAAKKGDELTNDQRSQLKNYGLHGDLVDKDTQKRLDKLSPAEKDFFKDQESKISDLKKKEADVEKTVAALEQSVDQIQKALDDLGPKLADAIVPYVEKIAEATKRQLAAEANYRESRKQASDKSAATG
jgi:hypothetical protein